jgi:hypothetical protein
LEEEKLQINNVYISQRKIGFFSCSSFSNRIWLFSSHWATQSTNFCIQFCFNWVGIYSKFCSGYDVMCCHTFCLLLVVHAQRVVPIQLQFTHISLCFIYNVHKQVNRQINPVWIKHISSNRWTKITLLMHSF